MAAELRKLIGISEQRQDGITDQVRRGQVAGDQQQIAGNDDLSLGEPIIGLLNAIINEGLRTREMQASIRNPGAVSDPVSPAQFGAFIAAERRKWSMVAKDASVHID